MLPLCTHSFSETRRGWLWGDGIWVEAAGHSPGRGEARGNAEMPNPAAQLQEPSAIRTHHKNSKVRPASTLGRKEPGLPQALP